MLAPRATIERQKLQPERPPTGFDSQSLLGRNAVSFLIDRSLERFGIHLIQCYLLLPTFARYLMGFHCSFAINMASALSQYNILKYFRVTSEAFDGEGQARGRASL